MMTYYKIVKIVLILRQFELQLLYLRIEIIPNQKITIIFKTMDCMQKTINSKLLNILSKKK